MDNVIVIVGPTAVGKTKLSIDLAKRLNAEIISGDSMQVYKEMDIGTGKITEDEMENIPHYMLNIKEPDEPFSVAAYKQNVEHYIKKINAKGKVPIVVGGSGLYIKAVLYDYQFSDRKRNEEITRRLEERLEKEGNLALYDELIKVDKEQAEKIHPNNYRRVIRALEIYETTGLTMSELHEKQQKEPQFNHILIGLEMNRKTLYNQINRRVDKMLEEGLENEVKNLYNKGYEHCQSMQAIGYKEIIPYVKNETDLHSAVELLKRNSRRYAKRQYTWFKNKMDVNWFQLNENNYHDILAEILSFIQKNDEDTL